MASSLTLERVRRDVDVLAHAGLDLETFLCETDASLRRAVPYVAACIATVDPSTHLLTGTHKFGDLQGHDERDHEFGLIEYGLPEATSFAVLGASENTTTAVHLATDGDITRSTRLREFITPNFGYTDELRSVFRGEQLWGGAALFRDPTSAPFSAEEVNYIASLSSTMAVGMRSGMLVRLADAPATALTGPVVLIVNGEDIVSQTSARAEQLLGDLLTSPRSASASSTVGALVSAARRYAAGQTTTLPRARVRSRSGMWFVLNASPLYSCDGPGGDVVVTVEEARPPEIIPIVVAAFGLTPRERDVTQLVLQGAETKTIATTLHLSTYTVQDHLKSIFDKAEVRSRRELIARIYFDQYVPRMNTDLGPSGWFAG